VLREGLERDMGLGCCCIGFEVVAGTEVGLRRPYSEPGTGVELVEVGFAGNVYA
jgi:hypothetical protein